MGNEDCYADDYLDRVVNEILGDVEFYELSGPNGPWCYKSLEIARRMNTIIVRDVDGRPWTQLRIPDRKVNDIHEKLHKKLNECNMESLKLL